MSDKDTYLKFRDKIRRNILKECEVSCLFQQKYYVMRFMEITRNINLENNDNCDEEIEIHKQLSLIIKQKDHDDMSKVSCIMKIPTLESLLQQTDVTSPT